MKNLYHFILVVGVISFVGASVSLGQFLKSENSKSTGSVVPHPWEAVNGLEHSTPPLPGIRSSSAPGAVCGNLSPQILDTTFGNGGTVRDSIYGGNAQNASAQSVAIQADGKIVVTGTSSGNIADPTPNYAMVIARYDTDGRLDSTFGVGGKVRTVTDGINGSYDPSQSVVIESNGKILIAGTTKNGSGHDAIIVARYTISGASDSTFGTDGTTITSVNAPFSLDDASSMALEKDGKIIVAGTSSGSFLVVRYDSTGTVDNTFGTNGFATTHIPGGTGTDIGRSVAIQPDGKIVVAGYSERSSGCVFAVARFNADGTIDGTFGSNGTVSTGVDDASGAMNFGESVALQQDGKILVAGYSSDNSGSSFALVRYDTSGSIDSSFAVDGIERTHVAGSNGNDFGYSVKVEADERIVVGGFSNYGLKSVLEVVRYKPDGNPDSAFGTNGTTMVEIAGSTGGAYMAALAFQSDGKIVETGGSYVGAQWAFAVVRYDTDGIADNSFGTGGTLTTSFGGGQYNDRAVSAVVQPDGKTVTAGFSNGEFAVARFDRNGTPDNTFGTGGTVRTPAAQGEGSGGEGESVAIQQDGKIVVAGSSFGSPTSAITVVRYESDGILDSTFGVKGVVRSQISGGDGNDYGNSVAIQPDGKIVVGGTSYSGTNFVFGILRLNPDGTLDNTFGTGGTVRTPINGGGSADNGFSVAIMPDGKILIAGYSNNGSGNAFAVACYDSNGSPDDSFGTNGTVRFSINGGDGTGDFGQSVAVTPDGEVVVAGDSRSGSENAFAVALLDSTGALDKSFGTDGTVRTSITGGDGTGDYGYSVAVQPGGRILVGGTSHGSGGNEFAVVRYNADGTPDSTFNGTGIVRTAIAGGDGTNDFGSAVTFGTNGKIVMAGSSHGPSGMAFAVARYLPGTIPFAGTLHASHVTDSSAVIGGVIFPAGTSTTVRFLFGKKSAVYTDSIVTTPPAADGDTTTTYSVNLTNLNPVTTCYYRISGTGSSSGNYFVGGEMSFTTLVPVPSQPILISPSGVLSIPRRATLVWHSSLYAKAYHLQISRDENFQSPVFDTTMADTSVHLSTPLADTTRYFWRVSATDESGTSAYSTTVNFATGTGIDAVDEPAQLPKEYALFQNYPNPFNPSTIIKFALPVESQVSVTVYDILGREVNELVNARLQGGYYQFVWDGSRFASGVYFYRITARSLNGDGKNFVQVKKLLLVK